MKIGPCGDTLGDGQVNFSFTLPLAAGPVARQAAKDLSHQFGLRDVVIAHMADLVGGFSHFVVYGKTSAFVDTDKLIISEPLIPPWNREEVNMKVVFALKNAITVVGACTGFDSHTVGLDAILNMKGCGGIAGLESYETFDVHNLGSQVMNEELLRYAVSVNARTLLISQVVTEKQRHLENLRELIHLLEKRGDRTEWLVIVGGPRIEHVHVETLGFDAGFGAGTSPDLVAAFIADWWIKRSEIGERQSA